MAMITCVVRDWNVDAEAKQLERVLIKEGKGFQNYLPTEYKREKLENGNEAPYLLPRLARRRYLGRLSLAGVPQEFDGDGYKPYRYSSAAR